MFYCMEFDNEFENWCRSNGGEISESGTELECELEKTGESRRWATWSEDRDSATVSINTATRHGNVTLASIDVEKQDVREGFFDSMGQSGVRSVMTSEVSGDPLSIPGELSFFYAGPHPDGGQMYRE